MKSKKPLPPTAVVSKPLPPTQEQIAALAHAIWLDRGCPEGRDLDNWFEAERQLRGEIVEPQAADDIPASPDALEPDNALSSPVERELDRVAGPAEQRSPTSL